MEESGASPVGSSARTHSGSFSSRTHLSSLICRESERKTLQQRRGCASERDGIDKGVAAAVGCLKGLRPAFHRRRTSLRETPRPVCKAISKVERTRKAEMNVYVRVYSLWGWKMDVCTLECIVYGGGCSASVRWWIWCSRRAKNFTRVKIIVGNLNFSLLQPLCLKAQRVACHSPNNAFTLSYKK